MTAPRCRTWKEIVRFCLVLIWTASLLVSPIGDVTAQEPPPGDATLEVVSPYFSIVHQTAEDGTELEGYIINGPPSPPIEFAEEHAQNAVMGEVEGTIANFPAYTWVFGCSAVSGAMIAAYYDRGSYPNMYTGPTNGGMMPLDNTSWSAWSDGADTYPSNPLIASKLGLDGRTIKGSVDDYWVQYNSTADDPYIIGGWSQHAWGDAIGDYMKTSQSAYSNNDGSTAFYTYTSSPEKLTCDDMVGMSITRDGTVGRRLFYQARGYTVTECYNQKTDNNGGGFTLANYQAEIDAGHPVLLNLEGHSVVGYGYSGTTVYIRDTWDTASHSFTWGGSYSGMPLRSVSIVKLAPPVSMQYRAYLPMVKQDAVNHAPTNITLSNSSVAENQPINTVVGTLSTTDPDAGNTFTYTLVAGTGSTDNASFNISGSQLRTSASFNYEVKNSYSIRVRTTDQGGLYFEKAFTITVTNVNEAPTNISLSNTSVPEGQPINTVVGTLSTTDPDAGNTFTYSLVAGTGSADNASFNISGSQLRTSAVFNYSVKNVYYIRVRAADQGGLYFEKAFVINVTQAAANPFLNPGFELGRVNWTEYSTHGWDLITTAPPTGVTPFGTWLAWLGGDDDDTSQLSQTIAISAASPYLHYWYWAASEDACGYDYFRVKVNGTQVYILELCESNNTGTWVEGVLNLAGYAGSGKTVMFEVTTDSSLNSNLFLDNISMSNLSTTGALQNPLVPPEPSASAATKDQVH